MTDPPMTGKILVVDDELAIRLFLEETLLRDGHQVVTAESGQQALERLAAEYFDLVLLDLNLGDMSGMALLGSLRQRWPDVVVIILTAHATLETAVEALRQGAHDYLFKPCKTVQLRESIRKGLLNRQRERQQQYLLSHLERQLSSSLENLRATRREDSEAPPPEAPPPEEETEGRFLSQEGLIVDLARHVITLDGQLLELSPTEFDLLAYLISEAPRVVSPQELVREVQGYNSEAWEASDTMRQHIYNIRQKIKETTGRTGLIRTVRGVGYTLGQAGQD